MLRDNRVCAFGLALAVLGCFAPSAPLAGQEATADTLTLAAAIATAREANPMLRAARASAEATRQRIGPAGALPNPELQLGLMNRMAGDLGSRMDPMTMNQLQVMQMVPWPGKLGSARRAARHTATAAAADATETERLLVARVRLAYLEVAYADRAIAVMRQTQGLLRDFREVSTTMYAVGSGVQQDVLRAQVEVARMSEEITRMDQDRIAAAARLNALLGRDATSPIPAVELPEPAADDLPSVDTLVAWALTGRAALAAGTERVAAAEASLTTARRELLPDFELGVAYQQRPAFPNMVSLMIGVRLPIFAAARELPMRREARAMRDMRAAELTDLRNETTARIIEARARAQRDRNLERLYRTGILPQARSSVQAALASYRVGRVNYMTLVDNQMTVNRYETETYRLRADYHQAVGDLEALVGRPLEEDQ
jgi:cobalt-zinc-cadmium efflux system outer membrane protein